MMTDFMTHLPGVLEKVGACLPDTERMELAAHYQFLKEQNRATDEKIRLALKLPHERMVRRIWKCSSLHARTICIHLAALEGDQSTAEIINYYGKLGAKFWKAYTGRLLFEAYRQEPIDDAYAEIQKGRCGYWRGYQNLLCYHVIDPFISKGLRQCCDDPATRDIYFVDLESDEPESSSDAFEQAYLFISLRLHDRARWRLQLLRHYLELLKASRAKTKQAHARHFGSMTECLECMIKAREAPDAATARLWAARAIKAQMRAVVENWSCSEMARVYRCEDLIISICLIIDYDFDPQWARRCCRSILNEISVSGYHPVFFKAMEWDVWLPTPEEKGWMDAESLSSLHMDLLNARYLKR